MSTARLDESVEAGASENSTDVVVTHAALATVGGGLELSGAIAVTRSHLGGRDTDDMPYSSRWQDGLAYQTQRPCWLPHKRTMLLSSTVRKGWA